MNLAITQDIENLDGRWKTIKIDDKKYSICVNEQSTGWKISLTNLVDVWTENLDRLKIIQKCEKLNPSLSIEDIDVIQYVRSLLGDIPKNTTKLSIERIELAKELEGGILKFSIDFNKGNSQELWNEVTMPLCLLAGEIQRRQAILLDLVRKKDAEISEYKLNGAELTRKHIETEPFNEDLFTKNAPKPSTESSLKAFEAIMKLRGGIEFEKFFVEAVTTKECSTEESDKIDNSIKVEVEIKSEGNNSEVPNDQVPENSRVGDKKDKEETILRKIEKDSPKLANRSKSLGIHKDEKESPKRGQSSPSLSVKRPKKNIHDFIS